MVRKFKYSDEVITQHGSNVLGHLQEGLPDFEAFDQDLGAAKRDKLQSFVDWAVTNGGDDANVSKMGLHTETVLEEMGNARRMFGQLRYWVIKAFPESKAIQRRFGIGRFRKVANSQESMISFMKDLVNSISEHRAGLDAVNTPAAFLDGIAEQATRLQEANNAQERKKGDRTVDTEERAVEYLKKSRKWNTVKNKMRSPRKWAFLFRYSFITFKTFLPFSVLSLRK